MERQPTFNGVPVAATTLSIADQATLTLDGLAARVAEALPGWQWLVRSDETIGGFANIVSPDFQMVVGPFGNQTTGKCFPTYAPTPALALHASLELALGVMGGLN